MAGKALLPSFGIAAALATVALSITGVGAQTEDEEKRQNRRREVNEFGAHDRPWAQDALAPDRTCPADRNGDPIMLSQSAARVAEGFAPISPTLDAAVVDLREGFLALAAERREIDAAWDAVAEVRARQDALARRTTEELEQLRSLKAEVEGLIDDLEAEEDANVVRVAELVSKMSARDAARMLALDDLDLVMPVLLHLDDRQSADILAKMDDEVGRSLILMMAERGRPGDPQDRDARGSL